MTTVGPLLAAEAAAVVRQVHTPDDIRAVSELLARVWGTDPSASPGPRNVLSALADTGGYVAGAFHGDELVGASYGITYMDEDGPCLRSQVTGTIHPGRGIGEALKRDQRAWAAARGMRRITWTFDPLVRRNARFNLDRLGARIVRFVPDFYGSLGDSLNGADETDRCVVSWELGSEPVLPTDCLAADLVAQGHAVLLSADGALPVLHDAVDGPLLVATPADVVALRQADPDAAAAWRHLVRDAFTLAFDAGLEADLVTVDGFYRFQPV